MSMDVRLDSLLLRWEELQEAGQKVEPADLCRDCPELADSLAQRIAALGEMDWLLRLVRQLSDPAGDARSQDHPETPTGFGLIAGYEPIAGYRLVERIGRGGFGEVWKAVAPGDFRVALKFLPRGDDRAAVEERGLGLLKTLRHPYLLSVFGTWQTERFLIIGMELAERTLLDRWHQARQHGLLGIPREELLEYFRQAATALDYLNEPRRMPDGRLGPPIQHRDVKPQNLLLMGNTVRVADFGLARVLSHSVTSHTGCCTLAYAAPEFFQGQTSRQSDQYSLAATWCHLRTGRPPFAGTPAEVVGGHVGRTPDLSMLPEDERAVVARALAKRPQQRWPSCQAFVAALVEPPVNRRRWLAVTAGVGAALATTAAVALLSQPRPSARLVAVFPPPDTPFGRIRGLAISLDGRMAVTNSSAGKPWIWDLGNRKPLRSLPMSGGPGVATAGRFLGSQQGITSDENGRIIRWDLESGRELCRYDGCSASVSSLAITPTATHVLAAVTDGTMRLWESGDSQPRLTCPHQGWVMSAVFLPTGREALSTGFDGLVRLWNLETGKEERAFPAHTMPAWSVSCSGDGRTALSSGEDGKLCLIDLEMGQLEYLSVAMGITRSVLSDDGKRALVTEAGGAVALWDLKRKAHVCRFVDSEIPVEALTFALGDRYALTGSDTLRLWELPDIG
jgi:serine/threonine protein kinase